MSDIEALGPPRKASAHEDEEWRPDIVVGVDFGMTHTGRPPIIQRLAAQNAD